MKPASVILPLLAFATSVAAQASHIGLPTAGTRVHKGQNMTVQVVVPVSPSICWLQLPLLQNSIMGSIEVGIVLSFQYCPLPNPCPNPTNQLGSILYVGKLEAKFHEIPGQPYENFTITIPDYDFWDPAPAQIIENRFHLIGAGPAAVLETNTVAVQLQN